MVSHLSATSPLRLVLSRLRGGAANHGAGEGRALTRTTPTTSVVASVVTMGGGLLDGDAISLGVDVGAGAALVLTTQASTKVFRGTASQALSGQINGILVSVPEPVACFRDARYEQDTSLSLGESGGPPSSWTASPPGTGRVPGDRWDFARL